MHATPVALVTLAGPDGPLTVAATERGVASAVWTADHDAVRALLVRRLGPAISATHQARTRLAQARPVVEALLAGVRVDASVVPIDLDDRPAFDRAVLLAVRQISWGQTASYGEIARRIGAPRAARAVGGAVARCPIAILIPCHRIIAADGTLGGYGGDGPFDRTDALERKRLLLLR
ncbi:MAG: methylated-DNA--[protein]-cysteine S-methyltransferase, partial [Candidatus Limnocylindrales bacterium]